MSGNTLAGYFKHAVAWTKTDQAEFPYKAEVDGQNWQIRINDFPNKELYTLLVQGKIIGDFDEWPGHWQR